MKSWCKWRAIIYQCRRNLPTNRSKINKGEKMPSKRNSPNGKDPTGFGVGTGKYWLVAYCKPFVWIGSLLLEAFFSSIKNIGLTWRATGTFLPPRKAILKVSNKRPICPWIKAIDRQILQPKEHWTQHIQIIFSSKNGGRARESQKAEQVPKQDSLNLRVCKSFQVDHSDPTNGKLGFGSKVKWQIVVVQSQKHILKTALLKLNLWVPRIGIC